MSSYSSLLDKAFQDIQTKQNLPELFCELVKSLETMPSSVQEEALQKEIQTYFYDINTAVAQYNEQYQILLNELGVLCRDSPKQDLVVRFFSGLLDLYKLAYTVYQDDPEKLSVFQSSLERLITMLETNAIEIPKENSIQNGLFVQLVKSAWAFSHSQQTIESAAKQIGGRRKNKTRKAKRS